jgi:hypothetical protein
MILSRPLTDSMPRGRSAPLKPHANTGRPVALDNGLTLLKAIRQNAFWGLFCTLFFTSLGMFAILVEVIAYLRDVGFDPLFAPLRRGWRGRNGALRACNKLSPRSRISTRRQWPRLCAITRIQP